VAGFGAETAAVAFFFIYVDDFSNHSFILLGCDGFIIDAFFNKNCIYRYIFMDFLYNIKGCYEVIIGE
jgi:hypothetical protein